MRTVILSIPDEEMSDAEWLQLAKSEDKDRPALTRVHGNLSTDGFRVHIVEDNPCKCKEKSFHENIQERVIEKTQEAPFLFSINKQFLLDALAGFSQSDAIRFYGSEKEPILIQGSGTSRSAIVMPMLISDREKKSPFQR